MDLKKDKYLYRVLVVMGRKNIATVTYQDIIFDHISYLFDNNCNSILFSWVIFAHFISMIDHLFTHGFLDPLQQTYGKQYVQNIELQ